MRWSPYFTQLVLYEFFIFYRSIHKHFLRLLWFSWYSSFVLTCIQIFTATRTMCSIRVTVCCEFETKKTFLHKLKCNCCPLKWLEYEIDPFYIVELYQQWAMVTLIYNFTLHSLFRFSIAHYPVLFINISSGNAGLVRTPLSFCLCNLKIDTCSYHFCSVFRFPLQIEAFSLSLPPSLFLWCIDACPWLGALYHPESDYLLGPFVDSAQCRIRVVVST